MFHDDIFGLSPAGVRKTVSLKSSIGAFSLIFLSSLPTHRIFLQYNMSNFGYMLGILSSLVIYFVSVLEY